MSPKTRIVWSLVWGLIVAPLFGCESAARQDFHRYEAEQLPAVEQLEHAAIQAMRNAHHHGATDADKLVMFRDSLLPLATRTVALVESIHPATPEVVKLHERKLECARLLQQAITDFAGALTRKDEALGRRAGEAFQQYQEKRQLFQNEQQALEKQLGVGS